MSEYATPENAIAVIQTATTIYLLKRLSKSYFAPVLVGLAALELPLRYVDDGNNAVGRETFLVFVSSAYVLVAGVARLLIEGLRMLFGLNKPKEEVAKHINRVFTRTMVISYIKEHAPTIESLVKTFGDQREVLFDVLETNTRLAGDRVVLA